MNETSVSIFFNELNSCAELVHSRLLDSSYADRFHPKDIHDAVTLYVRSGGKRLRPAVLMWCCGVVGGIPEDALAAACAVEIFHTWTLVHDDIIDRDDLRRGGATVHNHFYQVAKDEFRDLDEASKAHYGLSVAVLAGDVQHGWGISMMTELSRLNKLDPMVTLNLINELDTEVLNLLVEGEVEDMRYSYVPVQQVSIERIEDMLYKKTAVLYRFCARAGAMIGLGKWEPDHPYIKALSTYAEKSGIAFQLQDDILGVIGDESKLGKPVGSDIREGKSTTVLHYAWENASPEERNQIHEVLGKENATDKEVKEVVAILKNRGGIQKTQERAKRYVEEALQSLDALPPSKYLDLLKTSAEFIISRTK